MKLFRGDVAAIERGSMTSLHPVEKIRAIRTHASDHSMPTMRRHS